MNIQRKNNIRSKIRVMYGLAYVLREDIDNLRFDANTFETQRMLTSISDTNDTLEKLIDIMAEIEYLLYLESLKESQ